MKTDKLPKKDIDLLNKISHDASVASSLCHQTGYSPSLTKRTRQVLFDTGNELTRISARIARIAILTKTLEK